MPKYLLIVDDNVEVCKSLKHNFDRYDYVTAYALNKADALRGFVNQPVEAVILDLRLGPESGLELLAQFVALNAQVPIIMLTGYATIRTAVEAIKLGAYDYVPKPIDFGTLRKIVEHAIELAAQKHTQSQLKPPDAAKMITQHHAMIELCVKAKKLANSTIPILITGESGTGKELIAEYIHRHSPRAACEMVKINCSAFPETLIDNELFGHEKGAFTGANSAFQGVFERAHKSTLFLDEIADMPLTTQAKILRALQNQEIRRLGGKHPMTIDTRFIGATNKDLHVLLRENIFREDLYYRLSAAVLTIPPLRERKEDILGLAEYFLQEAAQQAGAPVKTLSDAVAAIFHDYAWPGNVRELKNTVHYAATMSVTATIELADLPATLARGQTGAADATVLETVEKNLILAALQKAAYN